MADYDDPDLQRDLDDFPATFPSAVMGLDRMEPLRGEGLGHGSPQRGEGLDRSAEGEQRLEGRRGGVGVVGEQLDEHPNANPPSQGQPRDRSAKRKGPQRGEGLDRSRPRQGESARLGDPQRGERLDRSGSSQRGEGLGVRPQRWIGFELGQGLGRSSGSVASSSRLPRAPTGDYIELELYAEYDDEARERRADAIGSQPVSKSLGAKPIEPPWSMEAAWMTSKCCGAAVPTSGAATTAAGAGESRASAAIDRARPESAPGRGRAEFSVRRAEVCAPLGGSFDSAGNTHFFAPTSSSAPFVAPSIRSVALPLFDLARGRGIRVDCLVSDLIVVRRVMTVALAGRPVRWTEPLRSPGSTLALTRVFFSGHFPVGAVSAMDFKMLISVLHNAHVPATTLLASEDVSSDSGATFLEATGPAAALPVVPLCDDMASVTGKTLTLRSLAAGEVWEKKLEYNHYMHDKFNDDGWGCAYRSLQTCVSWYRMQFYSEKDVPGIEDIQRLLKRIDEAHKDLQVGSKKWIGTIEGMYLLQDYLGVDCRMVHCQDASDMATQVPNLLQHLEAQGSPIMMGVGNYAYTLVGICHFLGEAACTCTLGAPLGSPGSAPEPRGGASSATSGSPGEGV
ncbi:unnamed protein product [Prorocentrum cordatum]|uniref:UFSP1/2/DUB catalytic domain-containing protein n=1 Tax=Prorocentrum cordatum TaxID=2364126 RepID=A0ABN9QZU5_9DINO|nr:unnamed protein product [Polarella glacialis]